jgi:hypothetical protein
VSFATITLYVASQRVFIVSVYFVIDSVRKLLDIPSYIGVVRIFMLGRDWVEASWTGYGMCCIYETLDPSLFLRGSVRDMSALSEHYILLGSVPHHQNKFLPLLKDFDWRTDR